MTFYRCCLASLLLIILAPGCKKSNTSGSEFAGPDLSQEEINKIPPPTYGQLLKAFELAIAYDSTLINNEPALLQAIYKWIKRRPNGELNRESGAANTAGLINKLERLTPAEWEVIQKNILKTMYSLYAAGDAENGAASQFPCDNIQNTDNTKLNAVQHAYWNVLMVKRAGADFASALSTAHESLSPPGATNTKMDLHNNKFGIEFAQKYPTATEEELLDMLVRQKFVYIDPNGTFPDNIDGLVYFSAKRPFDGTLTGSFTNPDSGGPWAATFDFNQCDNTIRGQLTIIRSGTKQVRRFSGPLNGGTVNLSISNPYIFENPNGASYCESMMMTLSGNENALSGSWQAPNCPLGGIVNIKR